MKSEPIPSEEPRPPIFNTWRAMYAFVIGVSLLIYLLLVWLSLSYS